MTIETPVRAQLPPMPSRIADLPVDARGYPVPYFVAWVDGKPDHRVADRDKIPKAVKLGLCWMCGQRLGAHKAFAIGPMCAITRTVSEPPSHLECLDFAARACPFLTRPHAKRRTANLPEDVVDAPGEGLKRNPGVLGVWVTRSFTRFRAFAGRPGVLFEMGAPESVRWYCEGRPATRAEVEASIEGGLPSLVELAQAEDREKPGRDALGHLAAKIADAMELLPAEVP